MRYPQFLPKHGTIELIAPSFGCATEPYRTAFNHAIQVFEQMGYRIVTGPNCYEDKGVGISNSPEACAEELNEAYSNPHSDVLISCGGGELMCEVVPYMDFERIKKAKPKWYMGYSDNTNFTFLSATICDTASIYGPCAPAFGMEPWHESLRDAFEVLCGTKSHIHGYEQWEKEKVRDEDHPLEPYHLTEPVQIQAYECDMNGVHLLPKGTQIQLEGRLIGGCMDCLVNLLGTQFDAVQQFQQRYAKDGFIWFLESCDLNIMSIRRAVWQMKHAGWFEHVKGFLIGRPLCFGTEMFGINQYEAVTELLKEYRVPIIMDIDMGHLPPMMPIVCGATAQVELSGEGIGIQYTWK